LKGNNSGRRRRKRNRRRKTEERGEIKRYKAEGTEINVYNAW